MGQVTVPPLGGGDGHGGGMDMGGGGTRGGGGYSVRPPQLQLCHLSPCHMLAEGLVEGGDRGDSDGDGPGDRAMARQKIAGSPTAACTLASLRCCMQMVCLCGPGCTPRCSVCSEITTQNPV